MIPSKVEIGVVGLGYVGSAVLNAYKLAGYNVHTFDIDQSKNPSCQSFEEFLNTANVIYVAVPTPMLETGECDTRIVESVVHDLCMTEDKKIIVIKSTVPPGTTERLQNLYNNQTILFNPEFLTEANYLDDYLNQEVMLIGKPSLASQETSQWVLENQSKVLKTLRLGKVVSATTAELFKYTANLFLATKVSFANEMSDIANNAGVEWKEIERLLVEDSRLGKTHWKVPGPDGHKGFGGTCFPKDLSALISYAKNNNTPTPLLRAVWGRNVLVDRPERDWEQLKGRAISGE
jgi:nucleotide sugar dehydrogenase